MIAGQMCREPDRVRLLPAVMLTSNPWERVRGLLGRPALGAGEGLLIDHCRSVHTVGMRYAIDLVFLGRDWVVKKIVNSLAPWRLAFCLGAAMVLEMTAGDAARLGITRGTQLRFMPREMS